VPRELPRAGGDEGGPARLPPGVTQLLSRWGDGDRSALDQLIPLVYDELRGLANAYLRRQGPGHALQPTALVHEVYVRLLGQEGGAWPNRTRFFAMAATMMRNLLVDHAREEKALKRGGSRFKVSLTAVDRVERDAPVDLLELDSALKTLSKTNPQHTQVVELRYFAGLTIDETAEALGLSHATVERSWKFARAWLRAELRR
jgi:RNA polymerase sigma factor (TIGR02999 family)